MPNTNDSIRTQAFLPLSADIPDGLTIRQYRSERVRPQPRRRGWRGRARLRIILR
jgi:hypothetical protein